MNNSMTREPVAARRRAIVGEERKIAMARPRDVRESVCIITKLLCRNSSFGYSLLFLFLVLVLDLPLLIFSFYEKSSILTFTIKHPNRSSKYLDQILVPGSRLLIIR